MSTFIISHCESLPGLFDECRLSRGQLTMLRPSQLPWHVNPPICGSTIHIHHHHYLLLSLSPTADNSFYLLTDDGRLSRPRHCSKGVQLMSKRKKEQYLYDAILVCHTHKVLRYGSHSFTCKLHYVPFQMEPPLTEVADIQLQLTTHLSILRGWKAELAWLVDLQRMVYPHKWSPVSYRSSVGQGSSLAKDRRYTTVPHNQPRLYNTMAVRINTA